MWFREFFSNPFILITTYRIELIKSALDRRDVRLSNAHKKFHCQVTENLGNTFYKSFHRHFSVFVPRLYIISSNFTNFVEFCQYYYNFKRQKLCNDEFDWNDWKCVRKVYRCPIRCIKNDFTKHLHFVRIFVRSVRFTLIILYD